MLERSESANAYGSRCFQKNLTGQFEGSEDCLFLNVWTPALPKSGAAAKPVLVWVHGGLNVIGSANEPLGTGNLYDGENLARDRDVVVVSLNYRLGPLGFLAHPELTAEGEPASSGNYAALDQIAALQWVKKNIAAFGGDPARVMIFGESAGALNTCVLVTSPLAAGLFSSALMQSGERYVPTSAEAALSTSLQRYWSALARNGNPNDSAELQWPAYELTTEQMMVLETPTAIAQGVRDGKCDFWDAHTTQ